jgi:crossover junction endodeoxyribonuclease RusA
VISADGLRYRRDVVAATIGLPKMMGRLDMAIVMCAPDRRRRDVDNILKATLDAMMHAGLYDDDSQIDRLSVVRGNSVSGGCLLVSLEVCK